MKLKGLLCIILLILQSGAFGTEHCEANKVLSVTASKPEGLKNFTSFPFENDFYFVGEREREGAINFKVSLSVQRPDLTLKAPETNPVTKSTNGGVITDYEVVKTTGGEKKISGKVYLVVLSAEIYETFKVDDDVVIGVSKGKSENPKTKLMAEAVGADDWTATIKLIPDDKSVEILAPTELSKSSNLTNIRITKGYEFEKKEPKKLELTFKIKGKEVKVVKNLDLQPLEIRVLKEGTAATPKDGLVVKKSDTVRYRLSQGLPDNPVLLEDKIQWYWRILKWNGTYEDWKPFKDGKGHTFAVSPKDAGIYEVKATVDGQDFFFKRKKDDPHSEKKKDENDCFGVVDEQWQINVRNEAKKNLGSKAYAYKVKNGNVGKNEWKCNLFVGHKADDAGADVPFVNGRIVSRYYPVANQWAGMGRPAIKNWTLLPRPTYPQPGWIVARGIIGGTGHVGFVGYDGAWISAGKNEVHRKCDLRDSISLRSGATSYQPARSNKYK